MKNKFLSALALAAVLAFTGCSDDSDDSNNPVNNSDKKYITHVTVISAEDDSDEAHLTVNYDGNGRVTSASDGDDTSVFAYQDGDLANISGSSDVLTISELFVDPYDGYEVGEVLDYDNDGNPVELRLFERDWDGMIIAEYTATITYDQKPNPFYATLEAAGIIEVLNGVQLNFSATPQAEELVRAKLLLPVNNPKKVVIKNQAGQVTKQVVADYVYNDNYPTTATFTETGEDGTYLYSATFAYRPE
ncbi:hypothetical protein [uncultured Flavobacterium sp.]|uniref:hypothetical protein n=1 Tax=uncultured Flavobacterium sp. TaxID=165435 RepID=UPI0025F1CECE|nr:hypothetical protein [uncultured Flavobacterium sp.]